MPFTMALAGFLVLAAGVSPAAATRAGGDPVLAEFRSNLTSAADLDAFDALTVDQRAELAAYLRGESGSIERALEMDQPTGAFEVRTGTNITATKADAFMSGTTSASSTRTVSAWKSFLFAGITISKTTIRETYYYVGASATKVAAYSCVVNANYDPFATVTSSKSGAWVSSGRATAECLVTVKRGVPGPWGPINWSTSSAIQFVTGNGYGSVTSHGWR